MFYFYNQLGGAQALKTEEPVPSCPAAAGGDHECGKFACSSQANQAEFSTSNIAI